METKFYTVELFFFFHYIFPMNTQENSLLFSVMLSYSSISRLINTKKKKLEIREGRQEQWKQTSTPWNNFFSFTKFFLWTFRNIPYYFLLCPVSISRWMNRKKNLEIREGSQEQWKHTSTHWIFSPLSLVFLMSIWKDSLALFGMSHYYL